MIFNTIIHLPLTIKNTNNPTLKTEKLTINKNISLAKLSLIYFSHAKYASVSN
ncbi:hypothetical protein E5AUHO_29600 [Citrobacter freundii]|nr:hypothetical protein E5AUHO_29600 [Citrobacter freundii]